MRRLLILLTAACAWPLAAGAQMMPGSVMPGSGPHPGGVNRAFVPNASAAGVKQTFLGPTTGGAPCPLTDAATIAVNATRCVNNPGDGVAVQSISLLNNRSMGFPTGVVPGAWLTFQAIQGASGSPLCYQFANGAGYYTPGGIQPQCGVTPTGGLSASATDYLTCLEVSISRLDCGVGGTGNMIPSRLPVLQ